jgi:hypothetical protein
VARQKLTFGLKMDFLYTKLCVAESFETELVPHSAGMWLQWICVTVCSYACQLNPLLCSFMVKIRIWGVFVTCWFNSVQRTEQWMCITLSEEIGKRVNKMLSVDACSILRCNSEPSLRFQVVPSVFILNRDKCTVIVILDTLQKTETMNW